MVPFLVIFGILTLSTAIGCIFSENRCNHLMFLVACITFSSMFGVTLMQSKYDDNPQPLDVYRGNTTLQVTYQDSIPIDSVVVYKSK